MIYKKDDYDILDYVKNNNIYQLCKPAKHLCINCGVFLEESLLDIRVLVDGSKKGGYKLPNYCEYYEKDRMLIIKDSNIISLKIDNIGINKIYSIKHNGLIIASRGDGFGARMIPMLNAMYLADKTGYKFGFVWKELNKDVENAVYVCPEEEIFDSDFIEKYSYTDCEDLKYFLAGAILEFDSLDDFSNKRMEEYWGWYCSYGTFLDQIIHNVFFKYRLEIINMWNKIKFSCEYREIINNAKLSTKEVLNNNFMVVNIRSGDIVFQDYFRGISLSPNIVTKYAPWEIAIEIIRKYIANTNILILSNNKHLVLQIKKYFKCLQQKKLFISDDLMCNKKYLGFKCDFYELCLMLESKKIYGKFGGYVLLPTIINASIEYIDFLSEIDASKQIDIIFNNKIQIDVSNRQRATSYANSFYLNLLTSGGLDKLKYSLHKAQEIDNNIVYSVGLYDIHIQLKEFGLAKDILENIVKDKNFFNKFKILYQFAKKYKEMSMWDYSFSDVKFNFNYKRSLKLKISSKYVLILNIIIFFKYFFKVFK